MKMKPFSSFPSPASSSNGTTTSTCISRILRRILCFSTLPLRSFHPFDNDDKIVIESCTSTPGLVARLMGLDSLPLDETPITNSFDPHKKPRSRQRIIIPFPPYQELQDDNFFILSFESRKSSKNSRKKQRRRREKENLEFEIRGGNNCNELRPLKSCRKKIRAEKANSVELGFEADVDSENTSPNSVLEFVAFPADQESTSSGEISRLANSKMRRPLSEELESCGEKKVINNVINYEEKWEEMGELAAMEMMKSSWLDQEMKDGNILIEIGRDLELSILDQLLNEMLINLQIF